MIALKPAFIAEELTLEGTVNMNCTLPSVQSHICDKAGIKRLQPANVLRGDPMSQETCIQKTSNRQPKFLLTIMQLVISTGTLLCKTAFSGGFISTAPRKCFFPSALLCFHLSCARRLNFWVNTVQQCAMNMVWFIKKKQKSTTLSAYHHSQLTVQMNHTNNANIDQ